jgi:hypothetical protein
MAGFETVGKLTSPSYGFETDLQDLSPCCQGRWERSPERVVIQLRAPRVDSEFLAAKRRVAEAEGPTVSQVSSLPKGNGEVRPKERKEARSCGNAQDGCSAPPQSVYRRVPKRPSNPNRTPRQ